MSVDRVCLRGGDTYEESSRSVVLSVFEGEVNE